MSAKIKVFYIAYLLFWFNSSSFASNIYASDQAGSCELGDTISFRCGSPHVGGSLAESFLDEPYESKSAIEFSLAGITDVETAELYMLATGFSSYPDVFTETPNLEIHGYIGDGIITYDDLLQDNFITTTGTIDAFGLYVFDVTDYVASLVDTNELYAGFAFRNIVMNSSVKFYTPDGMSNVLAINGYTEPVFTPTPPLTQVPVPPAVFLFASGLLLLQRFSRKS